MLFFISSLKRTDLRFSLDVLLHSSPTHEFVAVDLRSFLSNQRHVTSTMCRLLCGLALWTNVYRMSEVSSSQDGLFVRQGERLGLVRLAIGPETRTHQIDFSLFGRSFFSNKKIVVCFSRSPERCLSLTPTCLGRWKMSEASIRRCHDQARHCLGSRPSVRRLLASLASYGCPFDFDRHLACETGRSLRGGFDRTHCQVILYPAQLHSSEELCTILEHELIHALDYCRAKIDFSNPSHLACTEIRAAALSNQCSFFNHLSSTSRPFRWKNQHARCVKDRARESMETSMQLPSKEIEQIIESVFQRCYNDTEPFDSLRARRKE